MIFATSFALVSLRSSRRHAARLLLLPALLLVSGCGTAEYQADVDAAVARWKTLNQFRDLETAPTVLGVWRADPQAQQGTKVTFRKPSRLYAKPLNNETPDPLRSGELMRPERLRPMFLLNFPGYNQTWELIESNFSKPTVNYLYVGVQPAEPGIADRIVQDVKAALPELTEPAWSNVQVLTPEGNYVTWRMLSFDAEQDFWLPGATAAEKLPASSQIWMREDQGQQVFVAGRWSDPKGNVHQPRQELLAALGTVVVAVRTKID